MSDTAPTAPGPQLKALNALAMLIRSIKTTREVTRSSETETHRRVLDSIIAVAEGAEREARRELLGGSHSGEAAQ